MRAEEKEVEGLAVEQEVGLEKLDDAAEHEALPEVAGEALRDVDRTEGSTLLAAMRQILANSPLNIEQLVLPARELRALDALQKAVSGKSDIHMFVFAEDRKSLLEQALAVLQPNLTANGQTSELAEMSDSLGQVTKRVNELRTKLTNLEDAQDELMADERDRFLAEAAETDDKPAKPSDPDAPRPASTVKGPGPEVEWKEKPITVDKGPEAKREEHASTLSKGADVKRAEPPTTLGDPEEIAAATPWWQRPGVVRKKKPDDES